ncbi:MAG: hypothetical protein IJH38_03340 [Clostridia bacterium]|nr:hypothetical protein [Clostridia bacterium]
MKREALEALLDGMGRGRVALIGDLCLDMYWRADMRLSELSRETPHFPLPGWRSGLPPEARATWPAALRP